MNAVVYYFASRSISLHVHRTFILAASRLLPQPLSAKNRNISMRSGNRRFVHSTNSFRFDYSGNMCTDVASAAREFIYMEMTITLCTASDRSPLNPIREREGDENNAYECWAVGEFRFCFCDCVRSPRNSRSGGSMP